ncbi:peptidase dimerization domain protein, partial [Teladorsagia circumcincta]
MDPTVYKGAKKGYFAWGSIYRSYVAQEGEADGVKITCHGSPGHGSKFIENTAVEKLNNVMNEALKFREQQRRLLEADSSLTLGDVTTLNLTILNGGVQANVLPEKFEAYFDIRITPTTDFDEFERMLGNWCKDAGEGVTYEFIS